MTTRPSRVRRPAIRSSSSDIAVAPISRRCCSMVRQRHAEIIRVRNVVEAKPAPGPQEPASRVARLPPPPGRRRSRCRRRWLRVDRDDPGRCRARDRYAALCRFSRRPGEQAADLRADQVRIVLQSILPEGPTVAGHALDDARGVDVVGADIADASIAALCQVLYRQKATANVVHGHGVDRQVGKVAIDQHYWKARSTRRRRTGMSGGPSTV